MKKYFRLIIVLFVFSSVSSCLYTPIYNTVLIQKDDFKKRTKTYISFRDYAQSIKPKKYYSGKKIMTYLNFQNYHNDSTVFPVNLYLSIDVMPATELDKEFFINTDNQLYKLNFDNIRNHEYIRKEESNTTKTNVTTTVKEKNEDNSFKVKNSLVTNTCSKPKETETITETETVNTHDFREYTRKKVRGQAILTDDICRDILYSNALIIRYYLNDTPYTIELNYYKFKKLKEYFKTIGIK